MTVNICNHRRGFFSIFQLSELVHRVLNEDKICVTLGGDHAIGIGTIHGVTSAFPSSCLLWIDAHADINTMNNSKSGNMHGMCVGFNVEQVFSQNDKKYQVPWLKPRLKPDRIAYIGLRCVDPGT